MFRKLTKTIAAGLTGLSLAVTTPVLAEKPNKKVNLELNYQEEKPVTESLEDFLIENENTPKYKYTTNWWEYPIYIGGSVIGTILMHEMGHYFMAKNLGYSSVKLLGPDLENGRIAAVDSHIAVKDYKPVNEKIKTAAGIYTTSFGNLALTSVLQNYSIPEKLKPALATTSLVMMADRHRYIWSGAIQNYTRKNIPPEHDTHKLVTNYGEIKNQTKIDLIYGLLLVSSVLELCSRKEEIKYLFDTAIGKKIKLSEEMENLNVGLYPHDQTVMFKIEGKF